MQSITCISVIRRKNHLIETLAWVTIPRVMYADRSLFPKREISQPQRSCRKFIEHIHRVATNSKSSLGNRQPRGKLIGCALVPGDAVKIYARQSGLEKRPQPYLRVCSCEPRACCFYSRLVANSLLPAVYLSGTNTTKGDQSIESATRKKGQNLRVKVRRKKFQVALLIK
jgi:hypothetical protein